MLTVDGIPAHPLVVHAVVVLLPLAAVATLLVVARPVWRRQLGVWVLLLAAAGVFAVPVAATTGEQLRASLGGGSPLVEIHEERAESLLIKNTLAKDPTKHEDEALKQIYALLRPGDAPNKETAKQALERLFFSPKRYDLGRVGRYKINQRLSLNTSAGTTVLGTTSRAATLAAADRVVVLDGGRVAAVGHWRDLEPHWSHLAG